MMSEIKKFIKTYRKYIIVGACLFVFFIYARFPIDIFRSSIENNMSKALQGSQVTIGDMGMTLWPGVWLEDVLIQDRTTGAKGKIDDIKLKINLLPILLRKIVIGFSVDMKGLEASGNVGKGFLGRDFSQFVIDVDSVDLKSLDKPGLVKMFADQGKLKMQRINPMLGMLLPSIKGKGTLEGEMSWEGSATAMNTNDLSSTSLKANLKGNKVVINGLVPGDLDLGTLDIQFVSEEGKGEFKKLATKGKDITLNGGGSLRFEKAPKPGSIDMTFDITLGEAARNNLAGALSMTLGPLGIEFQDGKSKFKLSGDLGGRRRIRATPIK